MFGPFGNPESGPTCPPGSKWSPELRRCIAIGGPEDPERHAKDVVVRPPDPKSWIPVDEFYWDNYYKWLAEAGEYARRLFDLALTFSRQKQGLPWGKDPNTGLTYFETLSCEMGGAEIPVPPALYRISNGNPYMAAQFIARWFGVYHGPIVSTADLPAEK